MKGLGAQSASAAAKLNLVSPKGTKAAEAECLTRRPCYVQQQKAETLYITFTAAASVRRARLAGIRIGSVILTPNASVLFFGTIQGSGSSLSKKNVVFAKHG